MLPRELKHCSGQTAEIALVEYPGCPRYEVGAYWPDGGLILYASDDAGAAEAVYLRASLSL